MKYTSILYRMKCSCGSDDTLNIRIDSKGAAGDRKYRVTCLKCDKKTKRYSKYNLEELKNEFEGNTRTLEESVEYIYGEPVTKEKVYKYFEWLQDLQYGRSVLYNIKPKKED